MAVPVCNVFESHTTTLCLRLTEGVVAITRGCGCLRVVAPAVTVVGGGVVVVAAMKM